MVNRLLFPLNWRNYILPESTVHFLADVHYSCLYPSRNLESTVSVTSVIWRQQRITTCGIKGGRKKWAVHLYLEIQWFFEFLGGIWGSMWRQNFGLDIDVVANSHYLMVVYCAACVMEFSRQQFMRKYSSLVQNINFRSTLLIVNVGLIEVEFRHEFIIQSVISMYQSTTSTTWTKWYLWYLVPKIPKAPFIHDRFPRVVSSISRTYRGVTVRERDAGSAARPAGHFSGEVGNNVARVLATKNNGAADIEVHRKPGRNDEF